MAEPDSHLFSEVNALRKGGVEVDQDELDRAKLNDSIFGKIGASKRFEYTTLAIIVLNAGFIGYDADFSATKVKPGNLYDCRRVLANDEHGDTVPPEDCYQFPVFENFFAVYFTFEIAIRFLAYKEKKTALKDGWFIFDSALVTLMVIETWILPVVGGSGPPFPIHVLRLLRLLRITRMAKLMRFFPELQIIVKGMIAAVRSVLSTLVLLLLILYVWAILFTSEYHQGNAEDDDLPESEAVFYFGSFFKSMRYLFIMGTILDDITLCCNSIRSSGKKWTMMIAFITFVLISSFTMLNMLIGILCEVVCATGEGQRNKNTEAKVRDSIMELFKSMDKDKNGEITREEFLTMKRDKNVLSALEELEVKAKHFDMYAELMFKEGDDADEKAQEKPTFDFEKTVSMILRLRPGTKVSALDFATFQTTVDKKQTKLRRSLETIESMAAEMTGEDIATKRASLSRTASTLGTKKLEFTKDDAKVVPQIPPQSDKITEQALLAELARRLNITTYKPSAAKGPGKELADVPDVRTLLNTWNEDDANIWSPETYTC